MHLGLLQHGALVESVETRIAAELFEKLLGADI